MRTETLEGAFHGGVARDGEDATGCTEGVEAVGARDEVRVEKKSRQLGRVRGGVLDQSRDRVRRGAGDLHLATRLHGDQRAPAQWQLRTAANQGCGRMRTQGLAQPAGVERPSRILRVMHGPLELDAAQPRWTVLETDHRDVTLRLGPGADRSRRRRTTGRGHDSEPNPGPMAGQPTKDYSSVTPRTLQVESCQHVPWPHRQNPAGCLADASQRVLVPESTTGGRASSFRSERNTAAESANATRIPVSGNAGRWCTPSRSATRRSSSTTSAA